MLQGPTSGLRRWSGLDGLRALAVIAVVAFHFAPGILPGGLLGVDIFFVLSGYLITRMIVSEYLRFGCFRFGDFYRRRARRLLPALAVVLTAALAAAAFWRDQLTTVRAATAAAAGYVSNWWLSFDHQSYFVAAGRPSMLQHLWSLAVEEQFYLFWPLIAIGVLTLAGQRRGPTLLAVTATLLALGSAAEMAALAVAHNAPYASDASRLYYGTDTHSMGLLLGAALGSLAAARATSAAVDATRRFVWLSDTTAAAALIALVAIVVTVRDSTPQLYRGGFLAVAAITAVATAAVAREGSRLGRLLDRQPMRWLAARSYSIYLWHWPVAVVTRPGVDLSWPSPMVFGLRAGVTLLLADLTYRTIELPVRSRGFRRSVRAGVRRIARVVVGEAPVGARLTTATLAVIVLVAGGVLAAAPRPTLSAGQKALAAEHGGRDLHLGSIATLADAADQVSARHPATPVPSSSTPAKKPVDDRSSSAPTETNHQLPLISAFGDSVMLGARTWLDRRFPGGTLDAIEGRQPDPILSDIEHDASVGKLNPLVIVGVGDNGLISPDALRHALACLRRVEQVIVINNRVGRPWEAPNNRTIARVVPNFHNARILDWHSVSAPHPSWFYDDGIHLTPNGAVAYTRLIAEAAHRA